MKKMILLFTFLFAFSSSFISCRDAEKPETDELVEADEITDAGTEEVIDEGFGEFDANGDNRWDENEFAQSNNVGFAQWDQDNNGSLNDDEFYHTAFGFNDMDDDDRLSQDEWNSGYNNMFGNYTNQEDFNAFDQNQDGFLDSNEWNSGFSDSDWFNTFDEDKNKLVDENEWSGGLFNEGDANDDGFWDQNEYNRYNSTRNWS